MAKHIETLIWQHECIIVPQFGGFVTQVQGTYTTDSGNSFMPPMRTVGFNDKLSGNDGILVSSYMDTYGLNEAEAKRMLQTDILEMREQLLHQGNYDLGRIGRLEQDEDGEILFFPNNGCIAPEFYGLEALDFPLLPQDAVAVPAPKLTAAEKPVPKSEGSPKEEKEHITLHINRRTLHTALSIAAAILLFFLVSTPVNTNLWNRNEALLAQDILSSALQIMPRMETKEAPVSIVPKDTVTAKASEAPQQMASTEEEYAVVVASAIPENNAQNFVKHLQKKGIEDATIYKHGAMIRVLFRGFATESDARKKMQDLQSVPELQGAWILQLK